jgi:transposase
MRAYSMDLRKRVIAAVDSGKTSQGKVAEMYQVSRSFVKTLLKRRRVSGAIAAKPHGGGQKLRVDEAKQQLLRGYISEHKDATLSECADYLEKETGVLISIPTMTRALTRMGLSRKKK